MTEFVGASIGAPLVAGPDPVALLRAILLERLDRTSQAIVPVIGNVRDADTEPPFYVASEAGSIHERSAPVLNPARVGLSAWALTEDAAAAAYRLAIDLLHRQGPLLIDGWGIWKVFNETGLQRPLRDPDSSWWLATGVFDLYMTDRNVG
jgi:hypothetical protein